ncbi:hypothetical protein pb186bvf_011599 [Paramecium bursaria]
MSPKIVDNKGVYKPPKSEIFVYFCMLVLALVFSRQLYVDESFKLYEIIGIKHQDKLHILLHSLKLYAVVNFLNVLMVIAGRMKHSRINPVMGEDHIIIITLNRALTNSIEQGVIFYSSLAYYLFYVFTPSQSHIVQNLALQFVFARLTFLLGYPFALLKLSSFRHFGFLQSMVCNVIILSLNFGYDIFKLTRI